MPPMKTSSPSPADVALRDDILALIKRHLRPDTADRFLAIAAQVVGQAMAMQDQRTMTKEMVFAIVEENIEEGNRAVVEALHKTVGRA